LGEFLALAVSLEHLGSRFDNDGALVLASTLDQATTKFLDQNKSPSRKVNELDNRGSHFYLAMYWAEALAAQTDNTGLQAKFAPVAAQLLAEETKIVDELNSAQGQAMDVEGYYRPNAALAAKAMRSSATLNAIIDAV
jgi:isocitrate dehydrogenase